MSELNELLSSAQSDCEYIAEWSATIKNPQALEQNPERASAIIAQIIFLGSTAKLIENTTGFRTTNSVAIIKLRDKIGHIPWSHLRFDLLLVAIQNSIPAYTSELKTLAQIKLGTSHVHNFPNPG